MKPKYPSRAYLQFLWINNKLNFPQLRSLYPDKEHEAKYTELVRAYLDFDVEMENIGVFWSGAEALILDSSRDQQKLREKQKMLKSDWEKWVSSFLRQDWYGFTWLIFRFKAQRKQIENSLREKAETNGER